ncbi:hypothetical protein [Phytobacter diazotrophicus]|uniref:hypothetical protein n=1 Tax=Phytobacter diazotrophicus TaxID=395631 RepID=UPI002936A086|nr:hypothetical protein [Phytobacter diazotrophicus]MDV2876078.1 hypothetical protein [Phytobacter diazotrophicus]
MNKELSGTAGDVLHALFFRGALLDGNLPSKAGADELRELGYVMTQDTVTPFCGEHHFNFLTPAGQEFAISYLVNSKFGKRPPRSVSELVIKTSLDASELQSTIDEVLDSIRKSDVFKILSGQGIEKPKSDGQQQVVFDNDQHRAGIIANATSLIEAAKATHARQEAMMIELASARAAITESINQAVNDAIANALKPGGLLYARK